ncbi:chorismate mutase [Nocardioides sp.]|uniref:chorismate mutase n=1 Tax=Nocardioides sp. TaxID=35761 RepID=UPI0026311A27|nr:chorismate mutase [Nocardioides sp.]
MSVRAIRGATQLEVDDSAHMQERVVELLTQVMELNELDQDDVISILFTSTGDLHSAFPAVAARTIGFTDVPLMCARELEIEGSLPRAVRLMAHVETDRSKAEVEHVYLHGAVVLRPDLARRDG